MDYSSKLAGMGASTPNAYDMARNQAPQVQQQYGVASGYKDLCAAVEQIVNTVDNLRSGMGISVPKSEQGIGSGESPTLATQLRILSKVLGNANADLSEVLMHLNS